MVGGCQAMKVTDGRMLPPRPPHSSRPARQATFLSVWEVATFVCCLYVAFSVPYNVTFAERQENIILQAGGNVHNDCVFQHLFNFPPHKFYMSLMDLMVDVVFYVDIVLNFHSAVWEISTNFPPDAGHTGPPHWVLIDDLAAIQARYFRGEFATDLIGQIPWQYSDCFLEGAPIVKILRLFRLLKLLRLHRLKRMIKALYRKFPKMELGITALELALTMTLVAHWMACIWYSVGYPKGWVVNEGIVDEFAQHLDVSPYYEWISRSCSGVSELSES